MDETNLEYHIDEPVKKSVVGMALLGFKPIFSCCGFTYHGEKVKKTHLPDKPYIFINLGYATSEQKSLLIDIARKSLWTIGPVDDNIVDFHGWKWDKNHPWNIEGSPHSMEPAVLSLNRLEKILEGYSGQFLDRIEIIDGNFIYKEVRNIKHWQYPTSSPWMVTPGVFASL